jgi:hypothetical protein
MNYEHLVIKGTAIREHLNKAEEAFDEHFVKPVREWLFKAGGTAEVLGVAKPCIQISKDKETLDTERMMEDIRDLVKAGGIPDSELRAMVLDGTLGLGAGELYADKLAARMKKPAGAYKVLVPGKAGFAVRWNGIKGSKDRIATEYKRLADAADSVAAGANDSLDADVLRRITKGA